MYSPFRALIIEVSSFVVRFEQIADLDGFVAQGIFI
jgi:hypothetical protein